MDSTGEMQYWTCDEYESYMNGTNSTNDTDCEWVYVDLTCDNFNMTDGECWIYAEYNRCNDTYFYCQSPDGTRQLSNTITMIALKTSKTSSSGLR